MLSSYLTSSFIGLPFTRFFLEGLLLTTLFLQAKLVLTMAAKQAELFASKEDAASNANEVEDGELDAATRSLVDDLELDMKALKNSSIFTGDEERFAFARSLSRLTEMGSLEWVEREQ